ncbi:MAG TPA: enoyl-CoA hydratase-related protein [Myxococcaceae bacterium]|nr:enoyl-CoA hydratase-related protein [Myxococcaceae bacterium]
MSAADSFARLDVEDLSSGVRVLTLSQPARRNALDDVLLGQLGEALRPKTTGAPIRALLIRGDGDAFCAGYDLTRLATAVPGEPLPDALLMETLRALETCPWPSVAMVRGPAYGAGCDLSLACDFRFGAPDAAFCLPPSKLGIAYAPGGIARAIRVVGVSQAKRMLLTGRVIRADEAKRIGLLDAVYPVDALEDEALSLCETLAERAPLAIAGMKASFRALTEPRLDPDTLEALEALRRIAYQSDDAREGAAAFREKRDARFTGR